MFPHLQMNSDLGSESRTCFSILSYMIFVLRSCLSNHISLASLAKWDKCFHLFHWRHFYNFTWLHALLPGENKTNTQNNNNKYTIRVHLGWYFILYPWLCMSSSHLQRNMENTKAAIRPLERNQRKEIRKYRNKKKKWKQVTSVPLLKHNWKIAVYSPSMVSMSDVTSLQIEMLLAANLLFPNKFRLKLKVAVASIRKCLEEIRSFIWSTSIDINT